jgi:Flp pilus assembly protein TadD
LEKNIEPAQRSIAITPATGRTHFMLAVAYRRPGRRTNEANAAFAKAVALRPGATALNIGPSTRNASPVFSTPANA